MSDDDDRSKPTLIDSISNIRDIRCGARHVLAKSKTRIYSWGSNTYGQLGLGNDDDYDNDGEDNNNNNDSNDDFVPKEIVKLNGSNIIQFECGLWHTHTMDKNVKNGQNDEMDEAVAASVLRKYWELRHEG